MQIQNSQENMLINMTENRPFAIALAVWRIVIGIICCIPYILGQTLTVGTHYSYASATVGFFAAFGLPPVLCIGLPCFITGCGLLKQQKWAIWGAVIQDGTLISSYFGYYNMRLFLSIFAPGRLPLIAMLIMFFLFFDLLIWIASIAEGLYLLKFVTNLRSHRNTFLTVAVASLIVVALLTVALQAWL